MPSTKKNRILRHTELTGNQHNLLKKLNINPDSAFIFTFHEKNIQYFILFQTVRL